MSKSVFCFVSSAPVAKRAAPDFDAGRPGRRNIAKRIYRLQSAEASLRLRLGNHHIGTTAGTTTVVPLLDCKVVQTDAGLVGL